MDSGSLSSWFTAHPVFSLLSINYHLQIAAASISWKLFFFFFAEERGKPLWCRSAANGFAQCLAGSHPSTSRRGRSITPGSLLLHLCSTQRAQPSLVPGTWYLVPGCSQPSLAPVLRDVLLPPSPAPGKGETDGEKLGSASSLHVLALGVGTWNNGCELLTKMPSAPLMSGHKCPSKMLLCFLVSYWVSTYGKIMLFQQLLWVSRHRFFPLFALCHTCWRQFQ